MFLDTQILADFAGVTPAFAIKMAFSEGWANFYSMAAQAKVGVSTPAVPGAGDGDLGWVPAESGALGTGEDNEITVMRILWDLYDPTGEASSVTVGGNTIVLNDNVELGAVGVYQLVSQLGMGASLNSLLGALTSLDIPPTFADVFELNGASPTNIEIDAATGTFTAGGFQWTQSAGLVAFDVDIPLTTGGTRTFNRLGVIVVDAADNVVRDTGFVEVGSSNLNIGVVMKPSSNTKATVTSPILNGLVPGQYRIAIYGGWDAASNSYPVSTGKYYSAFRQLSIIP